MCSLLINTHNLFSYLTERWTRPCLCCLCEMRLRLLQTLACPTTSKTWTGGSDYQDMIQFNGSLNMNGCCWLLLCILTNVLDSRISCQDCCLQLTWGKVPDTSPPFCSQRLHNRLPGETVCICKFNSRPMFDGELIWLEG